MSNQTKNTRKLMCTEYPSCGLSTYSCNLLQDIVYSEDTKFIRSTAIEIRKDMAGIFAQTKQETIQACKDAWPKKRNPIPNEEAMAYEQRHLCNICHNDFSWKGYCPCLEFNKAIDTAHKAFDKLGAK
jgi:hypothetical protein